jgi:alpha-soluble NSF attachment protein
MPSRGDDLLVKAEKKGSSSVGWFGSSSTKWEEAGDLFQQVCLILASGWWMVVLGLMDVGG